MAKVTVDTLVTEFDQVKHEEFLRNNSTSPFRTSSFHKAGRVYIQSMPSCGSTSTIKIIRNNNTSVAITATSTLMNAAQESSSSSAPFTTPRTTPLSNKERKNASTKPSLPIARPRSKLAWLANGMETSIRPLK